VNREKMVLCCSGCRDALEVPSKGRVGCLRCDWSEEDPFTKIDELIEHIGYWERSNAARKMGIAEDQLATVSKLLQVFRDVNEAVLLKPEDRSSDEELAARVTAAYAAWEAAGHPLLQVSEPTVEEP
jgi:hypothetical protein